MFKTCLKPFNKIALKKYVGSETIFSDLDLTFEVIPDPDPPPAPVPDQNQSS